jgi:hypothetical protein
MWLGGALGFMADELEFFTDNKKIRHMQCALLLYINRDITLCA